MIAEKTWLKNGDKIVAPFTTLDCIVDNDGKTFVESAESISQNTKAVANIQDYLGVDVSKKRNLFDGQLEMGSITGTGEELSISSRVRAKGYVEVEVGKTYAVSLQGLDYFGVSIYTSSFEFVSDNSWNASGSTFTVTDQSLKYARLYFRKSDNSTLSLDGDYKIMIVEGSSPSPYVPYVPTLRESAIVAYGGSDATGYYVRFANGVQICWGKATTQDGTSTVGSWTFPMPFVSKPNCSYMCDGNARSVGVAYINSLVSTYMSFFTYNNQGNFIGTTTYITAIGRWK